MAAATAVFVVLCPNITLTLSSSQCHQSKFCC